MSTPKTKSGAEAEATGSDTITVDFDNREWTFPASLENLRYSQMLAFESNRLGEFLPSVLPADQHKIIVDEDPDMKWVKGLCDAWAEAAGFANLGE